jgi:hypothetical protein
MFAGASAFGQHRKDFCRHDCPRIPEEHPSVLAKQRNSGERDRKASRDKRQ